VSKKGGRNKKGSARGKKKHSSTGKALENNDAKCEGA
jgi:hypothetical protein